MDDIAVECVGHCPICFCRAIGEPRLAGSKTVTGQLAMSSMQKQHDPVGPCFDPYR